MRFFSILTAVLVVVSLYYVVIERDRLIAFAQGGEADGDSAGSDAEASDAADAARSVSVVAMQSEAVEIDRAVLLRGRTEAMRQVEVRAETSGTVISEPLRRGALVEAGQELCRIDPGTRQVALAETKARLSEALSRVPEAEARVLEAQSAVPAARARLAETESAVPAARARLAEAESAVPAARARLSEAESAVPAAEARLAEAESQVPAARARLLEAESQVPAAQARLAEAKSQVPAAAAALEEAKSGVPAAEAALIQARARLPEAAARVVEAEARIDEANINLNAALKLQEGGYAAETRVAAARAAAETARAGLETANLQLETARAGVESAKSQVDGARARLASAEAAIDGAQAGVENAKSQVEAARAGVANAKSQIESALAAVQNARSQVESARAGIETAKSQIDGSLAGVESAKSQIDGAQAAVESARSQVDGALAGVESAKSQVESAKSGIQAAEAAVASAENEIERLTLHAPFGGLLETDTAELGGLLQPGLPCATIIQLDPIKLVGFVPEMQVDRVTVGARAGARLASGREVIGTVSFLSRSADETTRTFRVEIMVDNADLTIRDGQTAEIQIQSDGQAAHLIPQSALTLDDEGRLGVRTVDDASRAQFAEVSVLRDTREGVYVGGLPDAADIIVVGQEFVTDGVPVKASFEEILR